jgi:hypothetical protein
VCTAPSTSAPINRYGSAPRSPTSRTSSATRRTRSGCAAAAFSAWQDGSGIHSVCPMTASCWRTGGGGPDCRAVAELGVCQKAQPVEQGTRQMVPRGRRQMKALIVTFLLVVVAVGTTWWRH